MMPSGETRLELLLSNLQPALDSEAYVFCSLTQEQFQNLAIQPRGTVREREGVTVILTQLQADNLDLAYEGSFACITLSVHSSLEAVGLIAAVASALAQAGIGVNPLAGYYHDHLFVPWERRGEAMTLLLELQQSPHQGRSTTHPRL